MKTKQFELQLVRLFSIPSEGIECDIKLVECRLVPGNSNLDVRLCKGQTVICEVYDPMGPLLGDVTLLYENFRIESKNDFICLFCIREHPELLQRQGVGCNLRFKAIVDNREIPSLESTEDDEILPDGLSVLDAIGVLYGEDCRREIAESISKVQQNS